MLNLNDIHHFARVVEHRGYAAASRTLRLPKSTLSHRVAELERNLGVRLLNRNTRQFSLTQAGEEFYRYAIEIIGLASDAEHAVRRGLSDPSGLIRLTTTVELSEYALCDLLPVFLQRHPAISIQEEATDRLVDIVAEGFDIAIRGHNASLQDSSLIHRHLANAPWHLFAGREYLKRAGHPRSPDDLAEHSVLSLVRADPPTWHLDNGHGGRQTVPLRPRFATNNMVSLKQAACANLGIAALPGYICFEEIDAGRLVRLLPGWIAAGASFSALVPHRAGIVPAVRILMDFLSAELPQATAFAPPASDPDPSE